MSSPAPGPPAPGHDAPGPPAPALVERAGHRYAAAVVPLRLPLADAVRVDGAQAPLDDAVVAAGAGHLARLRAARPAMHDGPVLALQRLDGQVALADRSGYFAMIATCDAVRAELEAAPAAVRAGIAASYAPSPAPLEGLPLRAAVHAAAGGDPLASGAGRAAGLGVSAVVTVPTGDGAEGGGRAVVMGRRSDRVAIDPGLWHIAPSGMLEALPGGALAATVAVELLEELSLSLAVEEVARRATVLGLVHDLTRLRPDLTVRLDLDADEAAALALPPGGEFDEMALVGTDAGSMARFWREHPPRSLTPAGAGSLALMEGASGPAWGILGG